MGIWSLKGKKILVVDDYGEMRSMLRKMLGGFGADDITSAATGEEAIAMIGNKRFDIVLCDYNLGDGQDGQQVLEEVKYRGHLPYSTIFIMITAESTAFMVMGALEYQPDEYLSKPVTATVLQARLQKVMEKKEGLLPLSRALENKDNAKAIELCDQLLASNPRNRFELLKLKCEELLEMKRFDGASELCNGVLTERDVPWARMGLGRIHFFNREYDEAQILFESIIAGNGAYVAAYDWLARTLREKGDHGAALDVLQRAVEWSPKSVPRQRALAETAELGNDYTTAEEARKKAIRVGKNSVLRQASDYANLAKTLVKNDNAKEALRYADLIKHEFKNDAEAELTAVLAKEKIYRDTGQESKCAAAATEALELFARLPAISSSELAMELTATCLAHGKSDEANKVVQQLVTNNHNDEALLQQVSALYKEAGQEQAATALVTEVRKEMVALNNRGVELLNSGKIEESMGLFEQALNSAPYNPYLNITMAQACLMLAKKRRDGALLEKARHCLDRAANEAKLQERQQILNRLYWDLANS